MHALPTLLIALILLATVFALPAAGQSAAPAYDPPLDIGVVLYDGAEPLDVFGPIEMWLNAGPGLIRAMPYLERLEAAVEESSGSGF